MKNWTVKEAVKVIGEGKDQEAIKEIVKHFPLFAVIVAGKDFDAFAAAMPDHVTVRKIENELNNGGTDTDIDENADGVDEVEDTGDEDLSVMSTKQLIALCGKRGIKVPKYGKNKQFYLDALAGGAEDTNEPEEDEDEDEEEDDPIALYKKCKKAGLKVAPKKSAKYYKDALKKAEQEAEEAEDEEDDWDDDDEDEEEKPVKKPAKSSKGSKSTGKSNSKGKAKTKAEPEEEDDDEDEEDEWDI